jgi:signal transduction histidine kinase
VRDTGPGVAPANIESIFDAFYSTKASGMGMGLAICRWIVDEHGGRLWAHASGDACGAAFCFTLPAGLPPPE